MLIGIKYNNIFFILFLIVLSPTTNPTVISIAIIKNGINHIVSSRQRYIAEKLNPNNIKYFNNLKQFSFLLMNIPIIELIKNIIKDVYIPSLYTLHSSVEYIIGLYNKYIKINNNIYLFFTIFLIVNIKQIIANK